MANNLTLYALFAKKVDEIADLRPGNPGLNAMATKLSERIHRLAEGETPCLTNIFDIEDRLEYLEKKVEELSEENKMLKDRVQEPLPVAFDMKTYEANEARYRSMRDLGKFNEKRGYYGLFLTDGRNLIFNLESSAIEFQHKLKDESAYVTMLHREVAESIGPL
jgi:TolA-binding protein